MLIKSLNDEDVQFLSCWYGNGLALGFKGEEDAIHRCFNWASNTGVTRGRLHWIYDRSSIGYVLTTVADITKGLIAQFRAEIIMGGEIPRLKDYIDPETDEPIIEYDEPAIDKLAIERANRFMAEKIETQPFMTCLATSIAPVYGEGHLHRAGRADD